MGSKKKYSIAIFITASECLCVEIEAHGPQQAEELALKELNVNFAFRIRTEWIENPDLPVRRKNRFDLPLSPYSDQVSFA